MKNLTTEVRRHGEESGDRVICAHDQMIRCSDVPITRSFNRSRRFLRIVLATLREIFDESAYERFLSRTHAGKSVESYREFLRESETAMANKPRCC